MMTNRQMNNRIAKLQALEAQYKEMEASINALKDELKAALAENGEEEHNTGSYIVKNKEYLRSQIDSTTLKKELSDVYAKYSKQNSYHKFTVSKAS